MGFIIDNTGAGSTGASFADTLFRVYDISDATKIFKIDVQGNTNTFVQLRTNQTANTTLDIPDTAGITDTFLLSVLAQTVSNKTLGNSNVITVRDDRFTLQDDVDTTKQVIFQLSGITTATTRTWSFPDATDTFVGTTATQTVSNKTLGNSNVITVRDDRFTLQDDVDTTKQAVFQLSGIGSGQTRTITLDNANMNLAKLNILTTKGDVIAFNGTNWVRVGVGTDGYTIIADSAQSSGLKWGPISLSYTKQLKAVNYTALISDDSIVATASGVVFTLYAANTQTKPLTIKNGSTGNITVNCAGADTFDNSVGLAATITMGPGSSMTLISNSSNLFYID